MAKRDGFDTAIKLICAAVVIVTLASAAFAENSKLPPMAAPRTTVVADEEAGVIRFVVEGKEIARIDSRGLQVHGDIEYSGALTDSGSGTTGGGDAE